MNIFEQEDLIKGLPDQALMKEAQQPSGQVPQYLVVSEIQRRQDMRKRFSQQNQEQPQGTVKDQILSGIAAMGQPDPMMQSAMGMQQPPQQMPQQPPMGMPQQQPMGMPQQMAPPQQPMPMPPQQQGPMPPQGMAAGGVVRMQEGRQATFPPDAVPQASSIIGQRINNPMNLRQFGQGFLGDEGEEDSFIKFRDPAYSYRAADMVLDKYGRDYGINTIEDMISRYAPPSDDNPTEAYIDFVSQQTGIGSGDPVDLQDPELRAQLMSPMAMLESRTEISPEDIRAQIQSVGQFAPAIDLNLNPSAPALKYEPKPMQEGRVGIEEVSKGRENPYKDAKNHQQLLDMVFGNRGRSNAVKADAKKVDPRMVVDSSQMNEVIMSAITPDKPKDAESPMTMPQGRGGIMGMTSGELLESLGGSPQPESRSIFDIISDSYSRSQEIDAIAAGAPVEVGRAIRDAEPEQGDGKMSDFRKALIYGGSGLAGGMALAKQEERESAQTIDPALKEQFDSQMAQIDAINQAEADAKRRSPQRVDRKGNTSGSNNQRAITDKTPTSSNVQEIKERITGEKQGFFSGIKEGLSSMDDAAALALMKLGEGVAKGDVAGGIARAGEAAMKQRQSEELLDLRKKLTSAQVERYQALAKTGGLDVIEAVQKRIEEDFKIPNRRLEIIEEYGSIDAYRQALLKVYAEAAGLSQEDLVGLTTMPSFTGAPGASGDSFVAFEELDVG